MTTPVSPLSDVAVAELSQQLDHAVVARQSLAMLTATTPFSMADGYRVQRHGIELRRLRGDGRIGMKMGLTSLAKMKQMGVNAPIYGHLTRTMLLDDGGTIALSDHIHPRIEPEIAFIMGRDLRGPVSAAQAMAAVDAITIALEVIDSRYTDFKFTMADVVADNASSSRFVLGTAIQPRAFDCGNLGMVMEKNGSIAEVGSSAAILDHPARSLAALVNLLAPHDEHLHAGDIVMAGGATAAIALAAGDWVRLRVQGLGHVEMHVG